MNLALATLLSFAASEASRSQDKPSAEKLSEECGLTGVLTLTGSNKYYFRGIFQEDQGAIFEPALDLSLPLWIGDGKGDALSKLCLTFGTWNSLHSGPSGSGGTAASSPQSWYESDFYAGLLACTPSGFSISALWIDYTSPNGLFDAVSELDLGVAFDDSKCWGGRSGSFGGLQPSFTLAFEAKNQADQNSAPAATDKGTWLGLGIKPGFTCCDLCDCQGGDCASVPVTLSLPAHLGLSLGDYYEDASGHDETFGFADVGAMASLPLPFVPGRFGAWTLSASLQALFLGDSTEATNGGDSLEWLGTVTLAIGF